MKNTSCSSQNPSQRNLKEKKNALLGTHFLQKFVSKENFVP